MSELREVKLSEMNAIKLGMRSDKLYFKAEADKVIEEKDKEIAELKEQVHDYAQGLYVMQAKAEKEACHHKYKRCLDKAKWCKLWHEEEKHECQFKDVHHWFRMSLFDKWHKRWLELAEKFKEGK